MCKWKNMIKRLIHDLFYIRPAIIPRLHVGMVRRYGDKRYNLVISFCILHYMLHILPYPVHTAMYYVLYVVYIHTNLNFSFKIVMIIHVQGEITQILFFKRIKIVTTRRCLFWFFIIFFHTTCLIVLQLH
jgi:hypothetical protein